MKMMFVLLLMFFATVKSATISEPVDLEEEEEEKDLAPSLDDWLKRNLDKKEIKNLRQIDALDLKIEEKLATLRAQLTAQDAKINTLEDGLKFQLEELELNRVEDVRESEIVGARIEDLNNIIEAQETKLNFQENEIQQNKIQAAEAAKVQSEKITSLEAELKAQAEINLFNIAQEAQTREDRIKFVEARITDQEEKLKMNTNEDVNTSNAQEAKMKRIEEKIEIQEEKLIRNIDESKSELKAQENKIYGLKDKFELQIVEDRSSFQSLEVKMNVSSAHCGYQKGKGATKTTFPRSSTYAVPYSSLLVNSGVSSLDTTTGVWKAGVSGTYQISWSLSSGHESNEDTSVYLYRNGQKMVETEHYSASFPANEISVETWDQGGRTLVLSLPVDSTLELRTGEVDDSVQGITFCVSLVHADL